MIDRRVIVTYHAVERARYRYGDNAIRPSDVRADVEAAILAGREGVRAPRALQAESKRSRRDGCRFAWTEDQRRCYLVKRIRDTRNGHVQALLVVTAIQGARP